MTDESLVVGATPEAYRDFFAAAFASLDENPRKAGVTFMAQDLVIDVVFGNPVFHLGEAEVRADFRGRWLPEHPVPLVFTGPGPHRLRLVSTTGNRIRVSRLSPFFHY